jgi:hypothetical protein
MPPLLPIALVLAAIAGADQPAGSGCVGAEEAVVRAAGDDGGPPKFSPGFFRRPLNLNVSVDGVDGQDLPISIEEVCGVPRRLRRQATQLAGGDGVALLLAKTQVIDGASVLTDDDAAAALDGADTAVIRGRLTRPSAWHEDEDGEPIPTFRAGRVEITD